MVESPFRENVNVRINLESTEGYPLLIGRQLGEVINSTRTAHQRFRFAQTWLPAPNGWAALSLLSLTGFTAVLQILPGIQKLADRWLPMSVAIVLGLGTALGLLGRSKASEGTVFSFVALFICSVVLPVYATGEDFRGIPHPYFAIIVWLVFVLTSFFALAQILSLLLKRKNGGFWVSEPWEAYTVQGWVKTTLSNLEPIQARLNRIAERITWLQGDVAKTEARLQAYKNADTSDLSAAEEVDQKRLARFSEELAELSPLHDTAQKHDASIKSLLDTLANVAAEHRPTPSLYGTYEGEEREKVLHASTLSEYRKYLAVVEKAEAAMRRITTVSSVAAAAVPDDGDEDVALPNHQKATA